MSQTWRIGRPRYPRSLDFQWNWFQPRDSRLKLSLSERGVIADHRSWQRRESARHGCAMPLAIRVILRWLVILAVISASTAIAQEAGLFKEQS